MVASNKKIKSRAGFTLVEMAIALFCATLLFIALVRIYAECVKQIRNASSRIQMFNECTIALRQIEAFIRNSNMIDISESNDPNRTRLILDLPSGAGGEVEFFTNTRDHSVRMHDHRIGQSESNVLVLPKFKVASDHGPRRLPDRVMKMHFQYGDDDVEEFDNYQSEYIVKIDMVLEDDHGNIVNLSSTQSRLN